METRFVVTGLAQWAGTRIRSGSRIRRVPGSIPGTAGSDLLSYFGEMFEEFGTSLGDMSDDFRMIFGHVWECCGDLLGPFAVICGRRRRDGTFSKSRFSEEKKPCGHAPHKHNACLSEKMSENNKRLFCHEIIAVRFCL